MGSIMWNSNVSYRN